MRWQMAQQRITYFHFFNACWDGGYETIFYMAMSDAVAYIWRSCGVKEFLYVSNRRLPISIDLMVRAF